jgi:hypothetical protein
MSSDRIPKMILKYQPKGKRNLGRPLKRWKDFVTLVTGLNRPNTGKEDDDDDYYDDDVNLFCVCAGAYKIVVMLLKQMGIT